MIQELYLRYGKTFNLPSIKHFHFLFGICVALVAGCDKPASKLAVLDGTIYTGNASPRTVMGVSMYGHYKLSFSKGADGDMKCFLTTTIHDGNQGWGQPETTEMKNLLFEDGVDGAVLIHRDPEISAPGILKSGQVPDTMQTYNENLDPIQLTRVETSQTKKEPKLAPVKVTPTVLMSRDKFEEIVGQPFETSDDINTNFALEFGVSLSGLAGLMSEDNFALMEQYKDKIQERYQANYKRIHATIHTEDLPEDLVADLSKYGVSY